MGNAQKFTCHLVAMFIVLVCPASFAWAQNLPSAPPPKRTCCSNLVAYAASISAVLEKQCPENHRMTPGELNDWVKKFHDKVIGGQTTLPSTIGNSCYPNKLIKIRETELNADVCYAADKLLAIYASVLGEGLQACGVKDPVTLPAPSSITVQVNVTPPPQCVCCDPAKCAKKDDEGDGPGKKTKPVSEPGEDVPSLLPAKEVNIPTQPVLLSATSNVSLPSDTRTASLQLPVSMGGGETYAAVGGRIKPYYVWNNERGDIAKLEPGWNIMRASYFSFGASNGPRWGSQSHKTNEALAIGIDIINQRDPVLDGHLVDCVVNAINNDKKAHKSALEDCLRHTFTLGFNVATASGVYARPSAVFEYFPGTHTSLAMYSGLWVLVDQGYVPWELGTQASVSFHTFAGHIDGSFLLPAGGKVTDRKPRGTFGFGGSLEITEELSATFGARLIPSNWDLNGPGTEWRIVSSISWAGLDITTNYLNSKLQTRVNKTAPTLSR